MGRKPAPRPLVLSQDALLTNDRANFKPIETGPAAERFASSARSPTSARSMLSPRLCGETNDKIRAQTLTGFQPTSSQQSPRYLDRPSDVLHTQALKQPQEGQQDHLQPTDQKAPGRYRHNGDKSPKSPNFLFHFGKLSSASRSSEKPMNSSTASTDFAGGRPADQHDNSSARGFDSPSTKHISRPTVQNAPRNIAPFGSNDLPLRSDAFHTPSTTEADTSTNTPSRNKGKLKGFPRRGRTGSIHADEGTYTRLLTGSTSAGTVHNGAMSPGLQRLRGADGQMRAAEQPELTHPMSPSLTTAPSAQHDRSFRDMMTSQNRNHSADRLPSRDAPNNRDNHHRHGHGNAHRDQERDHNRIQPLSLRDSSGTFFNGLKNSSRSAAGMISKGLFGKNGRNGAAAEREPIVDDEHYVLKVINQPLLEQTRLTRISKRLEDSRDRTEFWMPAFPWRAIDYLNYKGTDVEGLYRVPGSGPQIKKWQRKFDEEYDIDLFTQQDLYDINIIGSMLKAWLRELPDELFPKEAQERIARECAGAEKVPQMLVDELSNLPPFNYYLLFAITCHLSLLLAHSERNKMDFRNLCICFQPCMKIDAFSFKFLVCDWRDCWKGCINEPRYIEEEYKLFHMPPPRGIGAASHDDDEVQFDVELDYAQRPPLAHMASSNSGNGSGSKNRARDEATVERQASSSGRNVQHGTSRNNDERPRPKKKPVALDVASVASNDTLSTTLTIESLRVTTPPRQSGDLRPLSPIKPLSPMGF